jgi:hypothetical protein
MYILKKKHFIIEGWFYYYYYKLNKICPRGITNYYGIGIGFILVHLKNIFTIKKLNIK